jgi:hypothetical protein
VYRSRSCGFHDRESASTLELKREVDIKVSFRVETSSAGSHSRKGITLGSSVPEVGDRRRQIEAQVE